MWAGSHVERSSCFESQIDQFVRSCFGSTVVRPQQLTIKKRPVNSRTEKMGGREGREILPAFYDEYANSERWTIVSATKLYSNPWIAWGSPFIEILFDTLNAKTARHDFPSSHEFGERGRASPLKASTLP